MNYVQLLANNTLLLILYTGVLGLLVGSFLNVVIVRLPVMLERQWKHDCQALLNKQPSKPDAAPFNLLTPRSHCPQCKHVIGILENIPVISYLVLRGKCSNCASPIPIQYPLVEFSSALISILVVISYGVSLQSLMALVLIWSLIALAVIDLKTSLLPDSITLPLVWLGLLANNFGLFCSLQDSLMGAVFGYLSLWLVYQIFKLLTGKEGMGYGDFKLLALLGAWLGWQFLIPIVLLSSVSGSVIGVSLIWFKKLPRDTAIPFGPYLVSGGLICLLWSNHVKSLFNIV